LRNRLCQVLVDRAQREDFVFLTGDLGFMALEPLRDAMGQRFINAGVAEQNMISVAAALSMEGLDVWVYSIAPFCYARAFEQIRNDVSMHNLPVKIIGNGGGYAYGVMGATHHALEDYGTLLTLPNIQVFIPAFSDDIEKVVKRVEACGQPAYLRLGRDELPDGIEIFPYAPWRSLLTGGGPVVIAVGPLAGSAFEALSNLPEAWRPDLWVLSELPLNRPQIPETLRAALSERGRLCVIEEHTVHGSAGGALCLWAAEQGITLQAFRHLCARGYPSGKYGSQRFHRSESGLDKEAIRAAVVEMAA